MPIGFSYSSSSSSSGIISGIDDEDGPDMNSAALARLQD